MSKFEKELANAKKEQVAKLNLKIQRESDEFQEAQKKTFNKIIHSLKGTLALEKKNHDKSGHGPLQKRILKCISSNPYGSYKVELMEFKLVESSINEYIKNKIFMLLGRKRVTQIPEKFIRTDRKIILTSKEFNLLTKHKFLELDLKPLQKKIQEALSELRDYIGLPSLDLIYDHIPYYGYEPRLTWNM